MGYRSVRVLLQRPTGQRITRNSRLDSAEFERAPADLAFLHRFASLCFALGSARLASSLLSSPLSCGSPLSLLVPTGFTAFSPPSFSLCLREALIAGLPDRLPRDRIEILLRADCLNADQWPITTMKRAEISRRSRKPRRRFGFSKFGSERLINDGIREILDIIECSLYRANLIYRIDGATHFAISAFLQILLLPQSDAFLRIDRIIGINMQIKH